MYLKENSVFLVDKEVHEAFTENITECFVHAQAVCTRLASYPGYEAIPGLSSGGGEGPGDKAKAFAE